MAEFSDSEKQSRDTEGRGSLTRGARQTEDIIVAHEFASDGEFGAMDPAVAREDMPGNPIIPMLIRRKWLILGIAAAIALIAIPSIWLSITPQYKSTAVVRISPVVSRVVFRTEDNGLVPLYWSYLNSQVGVIHSPTVLQRVLDRPEVRNTYWYKEEGRTLLGDRENPLERLAYDLNVATRTQTEFIDVSIKTRKASESKLIVDAVVDEYKKYSDEISRANEASLMATLASERTSLQQEIEGLKQTRFNLSRRVGALDPEQSRAELSRQLSVLEGDQNTLARELEMLKWKNQKATSQPGKDKKSPATQPAEEPSLIHAMDAEWRALSARAKNAKLELQIVRQRYGESHPRVRDAVAALEYAENMMNDRQVELDTLGPLAGGYGGDLKNIDAPLALAQIAEQKEKELALVREQVEQQRSKVTQTGDIAMQLAQFEEQIRQKQELYEAVRTRLQEMEMEGKAPAHMTIQSYGVSASKPSDDRRILLTVMALAGAIAAGFGTAYLLAIIDVTIREPLDVRHSTNLPFLGQLPTVAEDIDFVAVPPPDLVESVRMVRTALLERLGSNSHPAVLVTSPQPEAGKTSVAILLARSLATVGKKVLLVEADLRRPALGGRLQMTAQRGLASLLIGASDNGDMIQKATVGKFDVLLAGEIPENFEADVLADGIFSAQLAKWKRQYDFVVLDGPPVLPVADGRILAGQADGTIMILRSSHCRRGDMTEAYAHLSAAGGKLLGSVLVGGRNKKGYGYYSYYERYDNTAHLLEAKPS